MQPTSLAAMSGGAAVKAENRGMVRAHEASAEEPRSAGFRPQERRSKGLGLDGPGAAGPNKKRDVSRRLAGQRWGELA